jgi:cytochrome c oxidase subunit 3
MNTMPMKSPAAPAQTGVWVGIAAITMSFAAYSSALIVRQGASPDWQHFTLPRILFFNTLVVLASSITLYVTRPRSRATVDRAGAVVGVDAPHSAWLYFTIFLGLLFLAG